MPELTAALIAKLIGGAVILAILGGFYWHYEHLKSEAAKVPGLEKLVTAHEKADKDRVTVDQMFSDWVNMKGDLLNGLRKGPRPIVATNPVCAPSAIDRELRNSAVAKLLPKPASPSD